MDEIPQVIPKKLREHKLLMPFAPKMSSKKSLVLPQSLSTILVRKNFLPPMHNLFIGSDDKKVSPKRAIDISCWTIKERTLKMLCNFLQDDLVANKSDRFYRAIPRGVLWMPTPSAAVSVGCCCQSWGEKRHRMQSTASVHPGTELLPFWPASLITWGFSLGATSGHH